MIFFQIVNLTLSRKDEETVLNEIMHASYITQNIKNMQ